MGVIAKYKFDQNIHENYLPTFNSEFTDYTITDEIDTDGFTIRTIESDNLPAMISFGSSSETHESTGILSLLKIDYVNIHNGIKTFMDFLANAKNLISVNTNGWDTSNITNMYCMFYNCSSLTSLDVSNFNTSNVTTMQFTFNHCSLLTSLDVSNFDTSKVTDMSNMFRNCSSLTSLDVSNFNTSKVINMSGMFHTCSKLTSLDVSNFDTSQVTNMSQMFYGCSSLTSLDVSNFNTEKVSSMSSMFHNCSKLTSLNVSNFNTENVMDINSMFRDCSSLTSLDVSNFNTKKVQSMNSTFNNCSSLTSLDVSNFNIEKVTAMQNMFNNCSSLTSLDVSNWDTSGVIDMSYMFYNCSSLTSLDLSNFNTENVTNMQEMLYNCSSLTSLDVSNFNTENVTNMVNMFRNCSKLTSLDVSNFNTENVTTMQNMFSNCSLLTSIDVSNFNTQNVTTMQNMFANCSSLTSLDLSNFNTQSVTGMQGMFYNCSLLTSLDLSNFNTEKVTNMGAVFQFCSSLTSLDISNFGIKEVTSVNEMFNNCNLLTNIGTVYCNLSTINKISSLITTNTKIYYSLPDISELDTYDNIEYVKYVFPTKVQLPPHIQLRSLPDGTCDELDIKTGILTRRIQKISISGNENWNISSLKFARLDDLPLKKGGGADYLISDSWIQIHYYVEGEEGICFIRNEEGILNLLTIRTENLYNGQSLNDFKKELEKKPFTIYYALEEEVTEKLILNYNNSCNYGVILPRGTSDNYNVTTNEFKQNLDFIPIDGSIAFDTATIKDTTVKFSVTLSKFEVDTTNVRGSDGIYCDNNLFKYETSDNDYEHAYIENDTTLHIYVNKSRLNSYDQVGFQLYLSSNPFNFYYAMRTPIISYVNYDDLDPEKASWEMMDCTEDGSITIESGEMDKTLLLDCMDYVAPTKNRFEIDLLKANTQYTIYAEGVNGRIQLNFGGNIVNFTSGNIYTSGETQLVEFYTDNEIKNLIIIEGDTRNETIEFFEGLKSSENVTVISSNAPFVFGKGGKIQ